MSSHFDQKLKDKIERDAKEARDMRALEEKIDSMMERGFVFETNGEDNRIPIPGVTVRFGKMAKIIEVTSAEKALETLILFESQIKKS